MTEVLVDNLDVLVSELSSRDKLDRLRAAAQLLLERRTWTGLDEAHACAHADRGIMDGESEA